MGRDRLEAGHPKLQSGRPSNRCVAVTALGFTSVSSFVKRAQSDLLCRDVASQVPVTGPGALRSE